VRGLPRILAAASIAASVAVLLLFADGARALVAFPWDWSPDEGLFLDWARRTVTDPASLYARSFVPYPSAYGPGFPTLLAPLTGLGDRVLAGARVLALAWTLVGAAAVYGLVRRSAGPLVGLAAAALSLAALDVSFWSMLVRPDGPMLTLWLLAALALLPARLERGADRLGAARMAAGSVLLVAAVVMKPTAVVHGAPLVLGWLAVDRRSALRLFATMGGLGLLALGLLQLATDGGYLWLQGVWKYHGTLDGLREAILVHSFGLMWPYLACAAAACVVAARGPSGVRGLLRESGWLLVLGVPLVYPMLTKFGASWNYLVPAVPALAVLTGRLLATETEAAGASPARAALAPFLTAAVALALAVLRPFPLPSELDRRSADTFYGFVREHTRRSGGPIFATRPELAYFLVGQPVEMEGSCFAPLAKNHAPGTELVLQRLRAGRYTLLVELHEMPDSGGYREAIAQNYVHAGGCNLSFYFGTVPVHLFTRRDLPMYMVPPAGTRCGGPAAP
jgi:hypothetical protein